jgi:hypothetical protein
LLDAIAASLSLIVIAFGVSVPESLSAQLEIESSSSINAL